MPQSRYVLIRMCDEHCEDQGGLLLTVDIEKVSRADLPIVTSKQVSLKNPKISGHSSGWVVLVFNEEQNSAIRDFLESRHAFV